MSIVANFASPSQWFILVIVCLVIFGAKRLPEIARGLGKGLGEFKKARQEFEDELLNDDPAPAKKTIATAEVTEATAEKKQEEKTEL